MSPGVNDIESVADARYLASRRLPRGVFQFFEGGAGAATTLAASMEAYSGPKLAPRNAVAFGEADLRTTVLSHEISMPVLAAPVGALRLTHPSGEPAVARATGAAGTIQCVSGFAGYPIEDIMAAATGPVFFQLYFAGSRDAAGEIIDRAKRAGAHALVLTVDTPALVQRERPLPRDVQLRRPPVPRDVPRLLPDVVRRPRWYADFLRDKGAATLCPQMLKPDGTPMLLWEAAGAHMTSPPTWEDVAWVRERFGGPVIVKGILSAEDARRAVDAGADAIVVSNHGGMTLDGAAASLTVLPEVVAAVGDRVEILLDSGVRRGPDVVKALALGARAVLIGRAYVWALAAGGEAGVSKILEYFRQDIAQTMKLLGCPSVAELDGSWLRIPDGWAAPVVGPRRDLALVHDTTKAQV